MSTPVPVLGKPVDSQAPVTVPNVQITRTWDVTVGATVLGTVTALMTVSTDASGVSFIRDVNVSFTRAVGVV